MAAAAGQILVIANHNILTAPASVPAGTTLIGNGGVIEQTTVSANAVEIAGAGVTLEGVTIIGPGSSATPPTEYDGNGIVARAHNDVRIRGCTISGFNSSGIMLSGCSNSQVHENTLYANTYGLGVSSDILVYSQAIRSRSRAEHFHLAPSASCRSGRS